MKHSVTNGMGLATACCFTAILNSVFTAQAQEPPAVGPNMEARPQLSSDRVFRYGAFDVRPFARAGVYYDDNIFIDPVDEEADLIFNVSPGLLLGAGDYIERQGSLLTLEYAPNFIFFLDNDDENAVDHDAKLLGEINADRWQFRLRQEFRDQSGAIIDVGDRVDRRVYTTAGQFQYDVSTRTAVDADARMVLNDFKLLNDYDEWTLGAGINLEVAPKVTVGAGVVAGFVDIENRVDQAYGQGLLRAAYEATEKLTVKAAVGGEVRKFQGPGNRKANLVFSLGGIYTPLVNTTIGFEGYRRVQNSIFIGPDQNYTTLGASLAVRQVIRERYGVSAAAGYEKADYSGNTGPVADREDDYLMGRIGADWAPMERLAVGVFYQHRRNNSSSAAVDFQDNQVGVTASYQF